MNYLLVFLSGIKRYDILPFSGGLGTLCKDGVEYVLLYSGKCFEWVFGLEGEVIGAELHLNEAEARSLFGDNQSSLLGAFPILWFGNEHIGKTRSLQDWEFYCYKSDEFGMVILLGLHMLSEHERATIELLCHKNPMK